jgi:hypothetical protein
VLAKAVGVWQERLPAGLSRGIEASDQTMGHLEEEIFQQTRELARAVLAESAQKKGDQVPPVCPVCGGQLSRLTEGHERSYQPRFGVVTIRRLRGWCRKCKGWCFPADHALGLDETGSCAPGVQEMAASAVSKLPVAEASAVMERISFKGNVEALRHSSCAMAQARSQKKRQQLWVELLHMLAADLVPERPDRSEPRAVKRKKNKYPRLNVPRRKFRDHPKRNLCRKRARLRRLGLM